MIDLRYQLLPYELEVDGRPVKILTGFRTWIAFDHAYRETGELSPIIFPDEKEPDGDWHGQALAFLTSPNELPRGTGSGPELVDYVRDGELIVASFQQAYGIDLTDPTLALHWHRFLALFRGLPESTKMATVMGYRGWVKSDKRYDTQMRELQRAWRLPKRGEYERRAALLKWADETIG